MKGGTKEGAKSAVKTKKDIYGKDALKKWGAKGGQARNLSDKKHLTFTDKDAASAAGAKGAQIRWAKVRAAKEAAELLAAKS